MAVVYPRKTLYPFFIFLYHFFNFIFCEWSSIQLNEENKYFKLNKICSYPVSPPQFTFVTGASQRLSVCPLATAWQHNKSGTR